MGKKILKTLEQPSQDKKDALVAAMAEKRWTKSKSQKLCFVNPTASE